MTTEARWNGRIIASSDNTINVEGNAYFPIEALDKSYFESSSHRSVCGWKGEAHYFNLVVDGKENANAAWYYPEPKEAAKNIKGMVAFWKGVEVSAS
jgi:uncharacterized protein (DUF427 family)